MDFRKSTGLVVQIDFFDFDVGTHHGGWLQKEIGNTVSVGIQLF